VGLLLVLVWPSEADFANLAKSKLNISATSTQFNWLDGL
jgi:hypothetical protein